MKKKIKRIICAAGILVCGFVLGACGSTVDAKSNNNTEDNCPFKIEYVGEEHGIKTNILTDKETNIEYIVVTEHVYAGDSIAITPRLKSSGELYENK